VRRDLPSGCDYAAYPSLGWGRVLVAPRVAEHIEEHYLCWRLRGVLYVLIFGRYFERRSVSVVRWWAEAGTPPVRDEAPRADVERAAKFGAAGRERVLQERTWAANAVALARELEMLGVTR